MYILYQVADDEILPALPLPTQPILSSGIFCTEYSRCSDFIVQTDRFLDIISSSLSRRFLSHAAYHRSSQSQIKGLSARGRTEENRDVRKWDFMQEISEFLFVKKENINTRINQFLLLFNKIYFKK